MPRCGDLVICVTTTDRQTADKTDCSTPCTYTRGNYTHMTMGTTASLLIMSPVAIHFLAVIR